MKGLFVVLISIIAVGYFVACSKSDTPILQLAPTISSFAPVKDTAGALLTITGTNFSTTAANNIVQFNGVNATVISASATEIVVRIPSGSNVSGAITITISGQAASSVSNFRLLSRNEVLLLGNWTYKTALRSDTIMIGGTITYANSFQNSNLDPLLNYMIFTDSGKVYSVQQAWGLGLSGAYFKDTVNYTINDNQVYLSYPAGVNTYGPGFSYPAYQDTIQIKTLTNNTLSISRNYHSKHLVYFTGEIKQSVDSLTR